MIFNALVPELYVKNFQKSLDFYVGVLGFKIEYQRQNPLFAFLSYGESQLMIQEDDDNEDWHTGKLDYPFGRGINFQIRTWESTTLVEKLKRINYPLKRELQDSWYQAGEAVYGYRQFLVMDPDGYLLRFSQPLD